MELHGLLDHVGAMQHCGERSVDATRGGGRGEQQTGDGVRVTLMRRLWRLNARVARQNLGNRVGTLDCE